MNAQMRVDEAELMRQHRAHEARRARLWRAARRQEWETPRPVVVEPIHVTSERPEPVCHDHGFDSHVTAWRVAAWVRPDIVTSDNVAVVTVPQILAEVAAFYRMSQVDMLARRMLKAHVKGRQIAMYFAKTMTTRSFAAIGAAMERDHATVMHGARKIEAALATDLRLAAEVEALRLKLIGGDAP